MSRHSALRQSAEQKEGGDSLMCVQPSFTLHPSRDAYAPLLPEDLRWTHPRRIIYRDLKPENLLLTDKGHIKLTDGGRTHAQPRSRCWSVLRSAAQPSSMSETHGCAHHSDALRMLVPQESRCMCTDDARWHRFRRRRFNIRVVLRTHTLQRSVKLLMSVRLA